MLNILLEVTQTHFLTGPWDFQSGNKPVGIFTTIHAAKWEGLKPSD